MSDHESEQGNKDGGGDPGDEQSGADKEMVDVETHTQVETGGDGEPKGDK